MVPTYEMGCRVSESVEDGATRGVRGTAAHEPASGAAHDPAHDRVGASAHAPAHAPGHDRAPGPARDRDEALRRSYWPYAIGRSAACAALAIAITFSQDHSARFGLGAVALFALASSIVGFFFVRSAARMFPPARILIAQGVVSAATALLAGALFVADSSGALTAGSTGAGIRSLLVVLAGWAAITGSLEVFLGLRSRGRHPGAADWLAVGAFTMVAALIFVLLPPDFSRAFTGEQDVSGVLDSAIITVGLFGAYAAVCAVFLVIAAVSAKWTTDVPELTSPATESDSR